MVNGTPFFWHTYGSVMGIAVWIIFLHFSLFVVERKMDCLPRVWKNTWNTLSKKWFPALSQGYPQSSFRRMGIFLTKTSSDKGVPPIYGNPEISHLFGNLASLEAPSGNSYMEYIYPISTARWCPPSDVCCFKNKGIANLTIAACSKLVNSKSEEFDPLNHHRKFKLNQQTSPKFLVIYHTYIYVYKNQIYIYIYIYVHT